MVEKQNKYRMVLICATLVFVTLVAYEPVRHNKFVVYDDYSYITENSHITSEFNLESVRWTLTCYWGNWHPLTWLSHMLDYQLFRLNPVGHHSVNLFLHIINLLLLFWILKQMTGRIWASAFVACAFAIHPLHVESVAWAAERKDVLSSFFWMTTIAAYIRYSEKPGIGRYLLVLVSMVLGLMSKGMVVTLPFVLLLLDYWPLRRFTLPGESVKSRYSTAGPLKLFIEKIPLFMLVFICSILVFMAEKGDLSLLSEADNLSLKSKIANASVSYISYIIKMVYPVKLAVLYPFRTNIPLWKFVTCLGLLISVTSGTILTARKKPYFIIGWCWYLGTLIPVIGLVQIGVHSMADRYTYLPSIGFFIMLAWGISDLISSYHYKKIACSTFLAAVILIMIMLTRVQVGYWKNTFILYNHTLEVTKNNYVIYTYYGRLFEQKDDHEKAIQYLNKALTINPSYVPAVISLGEVLKKLGKVEEAINKWQKVLEVEPNNIIVNYNLGITMAERNKNSQAARYFENALAVKCSGNALRIESESVKLLNLYDNYGLLLGRMGDYKTAIQYLSKAYAIDPNCTPVINNLGQVLKKVGKIEEAISKWQKVLETEPDDFPANYNLGTTMMEQGKCSQAVKYFEKALKINPDSLEVLNNLAYILATIQKPKVYNPEKALELAQKACELTEYKQPFILDTLALAYAANGDFPKAVDTANKALLLNKPSENHELAEEIRKHLKSFKEGKPYYQQSAEVGKLK